MIKQHEHYGFSSINIQLGAEKVGAYFVLTYVYFDEHLKPHVEVFDEYNASKVGAGNVALDRRKNAASIILYHRYGHASDEMIERVAAVLFYCNGSGLLPVEQLDTIVKEVG